MDYRALGRTRTSAAPTLRRDDSDSQAKQLSALVRFRFSDDSIDALQKRSFLPQNEAPCLREFKILFTVLILPQS
jgi:hypothetical protein